MMGRGGDSAGKRRIKAQRLEKKAAKAERRSDRAAAGDEDEVVDEAALMQRFSQISEQHAAGALKTEEFEIERHEIFVALGLEPADD
jgi:hypothetical protein